MLLFPKNVGNTISGKTNDKQQLPIEDVCGLGYQKKQREEIENIPRPPEKLLPAFSYYTVQLQCVSIFASKRCLNNAVSIIPVIEGLLEKEFTDAEVAELDGHDLVADFNKLKVEKMPALQIIVQQCHGP